MHMNELHKYQLELLAELEQKLEEIRAPLLDTHLKFLCDTASLERDIAGVGEIVEEEAPDVPRYDLMKCGVAVGVNGLAPGELMGPFGVAIDESTGNIHHRKALFQSISLLRERRLPK